MKIFNVFKRVEELEDKVFDLRCDVRSLKISQTSKTENDEETPKRKAGLWCRGCEYFDEGLITSPSGRSATVMTCKLNHVCEDRKEAVKCSGECKNE